MSPLHSWIVTLQCRQLIWTNTCRVSVCVCSSWGDGAEYPFVPGIEAYTHWINCHTLLHHLSRSVCVSLCVSVCGVNLSYCKEVLPQVDVPRLFFQREEERGGRREKRLGCGCSGNDGFAFKLVFTDSVQSHTNTDIWGMKTHSHANVFPQSHTEWKS